MLNWDILNVRDFFVIGIIAIIAVFIFTKFSDKDSK